MLVRERSFKFYIKSSEKAIEKGFMNEGFEPEHSAVTHVDFVSEALFRAEKRSQ